MSGKAAHIRRLQDLKPRQIQVLVGMSAGKNAKEIGGDLGLHVLPSGRCPGLEYHVAALQRKTGLRTKAELTRLAVRLGVADINP